MITSESIISAGPYEIWQRLERFSANRARDIESKHAHCFWGRLVPEPAAPHPRTPIFYYLPVIWFKEWYAASEAGCSGDSKTDELMKVSTISRFPLDMDAFWQ